MADTAAATSDTTDPDPTDNAATVTTRVTPRQADLAVTKAGPSTVSEGGTVTYVVTVTNNGPDAAANVVVTDTVTGGTLVSATPSQGTCTTAANVATCPIGNLASGASASVTIVATAPTAGTPVADTAAATSSTADPNPANNTATVTTTVNFLSVDLYKCYQADNKEKFKQQTVTLKDQFGTETVKVTDVDQLCNPASMDNSRITQPNAHLVCYTIKSSSSGKEDDNDKSDNSKSSNSKSDNNKSDSQYGSSSNDSQHGSKQIAVEVRNAFGTQKLKVKKAVRLCNPAAKSLTNRDPGAVPARVDHYKCYSVDGKSDKRKVTLTDQFGTSRSVVDDPVTLCNPVDKNGSGIRQPTQHLVCYAIKGNDDDDKHLTAFTRDQFGLLTLKVKQAETLCLPSTKRVL
jgi:uncharacterized repeat protein (TIGR01451 family)